MDLTLASLLEVIERLGWTGGRTDLLMYSKYVLFKGIDTIIDEKRIWLGLKLNVYAPPFNPKLFTQTTERSNNNASHHDIERNLDKNIEEKINTTKDQKNTFQQIKQHKEPTK